MDTDGRIVLTGIAADLNKYYIKVGGGWSWFKPADEEDIVCVWKLKKIDKKKLSTIIGREYIK